MKCLAEPKIPCIFTSSNVYRTKIIVVLFCKCTFLKINFLRSVMITDKTLMTAGVAMDISFKRVCWSLPTLTRCSCHLLMTTFKRHPYCPFPSASNQTYPWSNIDLFSNINNHLLLYCRVFL